MAPRRLSYTEAAQIAEDFAAPSNENEAVRNTAEALLVMTEWRDRMLAGRLTSQDLTELRQGLQQVVTAWPGVWRLPYASPGYFVMCVPGLHAAACVDTKIGDRGFWRRRAAEYSVKTPSVGVVAWYATATGPSKPDALTAAGLPAKNITQGALSTLKEIEDGRLDVPEESSPEDREAWAAPLESMVSAVAGVLLDATEVMGPRTPEAVSRIRSAVDALPSACSELQYAVKEYLAWPDSGTRSQALSVSRNLAYAVDGDDLKVVDSKHPSLVLVVSGKCSYVSGFGPHSSILDVVRAVQHKIAVARRALEPGPDPSLIQECVSSDWRAAVRPHADKADWHLARARKSPALWQ